MVMMEETQEELTLSRVTKALIFGITVVSTEAGSNYGLYLAMGVWLELPLVINIEKSILDYIRNLRGKRHE